MWVFINSYCCC